MQRDDFQRTASFGKLLGPNAPLSHGRGVPSLAELRQIEAGERRLRQARLRHAQAMQQEVTHHAFDYTRRSFIERFAEGVRVVAGRGAELFDPEATMTLAG